MLKQSKCGMAFVVFAEKSDFIILSTPPPLVVVAQRDPFTRFVDHTQTHHIRQGSSRRVISSTQRPLYLSTQNTHNRQTSIPHPGFEPTIAAGERQQTHALGRAATGTECRIS